jgi:hypothetical protein
MNALTLGMIHSCNVLRSTQDQKLEFVSGSAVFTVGALLSGSDSAATGTVKSVSLESGSWTTGDAAGYLVLSNVSGTFQAGEKIYDERGGASFASGQAEPHTNGVGTPQLTTTSTPYSCRFSQANKSGGTITSQESGDYIVSEPLLFLPGEAVVQEGDLIKSNTPGYNKTYKVMHVETLYEFFKNSSGEYEIDHLEAELKAVEKRS